MQNGFEVFLLLQKKGKQHKDVTYTVYILAVSLLVSEIATRSALGSWESPGSIQGTGAQLFAQPIVQPAAQLIL